MRLLIITISFFVFGLMLAAPVAAAPEDVEGIEAQPCRAVFVGGKGQLDSCTGERWTGALKREPPTSFIGNSNPPADFCTFAPCIVSFWEGRGTVVLCHDGKYSKSGGRPGACSTHGGTS